jgi:hypothetical protein
VIGKRFGKLVVIKDSGERTHDHILYKCQCDCGNVTLVKSSRLINGETRSCGCLRHKKGRHFTKSVPVIRKATLDKIGLKMNRLTIIDFKKELNKPIDAVLLCDCGNVIIKHMKDFSKGKIKSCGCLSREISQRAKIKRETPKPPKVYIYNPPNDITGKTYKNITVLYWCGVRTEKRGSKAPLWLCRCSCGREFVKTTTSITGKGDICGCTLKKNRQKRAEKLNIKRQEERVKLISSLPYIEESLNHTNRRSLKTIRNRVFIKHGDNCLRCGQKNSKKEPLCIHHLKMYWLYPKLRYLTVNNVPLCRECHDELHRKLGSFNPSVKDQINFIRNINNDVYMGSSINEVGWQTVESLELSTPPASEKDCFYYQAIKSVESITDATIT